MRIAVLLKQVPDTNSRIIVRDGRVDESDLKWITSPYDEYALEAALQHREAMGGSVVAITIGPERAVKVLKDAAAVGVDELIRVWDDGWGALDALGTAEVLAGVLRAADVGIAYCGKQAADRDLGATGACLAELMGWSLVGGITGLEFGATLVVDRPAAEGTERVEIDGGAILTCDKGLNDPRRPNVKGIMAAKRATVDGCSGGDIGVTPTPRITLVGHTAPAEKPPGQTFEGAETVATVIQLLREEAKVL